MNILLSQDFVDNILEVVSLFPLVEPSAGPYAPESLFGSFQSVAGSSTSNMLKHLKNVHKIELVTNRKRSHPSKSSTIPAKQRKNDNAIDNLLIEWICEIQAKMLLNFTVVNNSKVTAVNWDSITTGYILRVLKYYLSVRSI